MVGPHPDADFKNVFPRTVVKPGELKNIRLQPVTLAGLLFQVMPLVRSGRIQFAATFVIPMIENPLFEIVLNHIETVHRQSAAM